MTGKIETGEVVTQQTSRMLQDQTTQPNNDVGAGCNVSRDCYRDAKALEPQNPDLHLTDSLHSSGSSVNLSFVVSRWARRLARTAFGGPPAGLCLSPRPPPCPKPQPGPDQNSRLPGPVIRANLMKRRVVSHGATATTASIISSAQVTIKKTMPTQPIFPWGQHRPNPQVEEDPSASLLITRTPIAQFAPERERNHARPIRLHDGFPTLWADTPERPIQRYRKTTLHAAKSGDDPILQSHAMGAIPQRGQKPRRDHQVMQRDKARLDSPLLSVFCPLGGVKRVP